MVYTIIMNRVIHKEIIPSTDPRLKRLVHHDSKSKEYQFDTTGIQLVSTRHTRHIPILDQGNVGSCTGNAGIGALGTDPFPQTPNGIYSFDESGAQKLYSDAESLDGDGPFPPNDNGSSGLSIAKVLKAKGLISGYQHNFTLQNTLLALVKYPLLIGSYWFTGMDSLDTDGRAHPNGTIRGGHEYLADEIDVENGKVWFDNSWGEGWGIRGRFYLTWEDLAFLLNQRGDSTVLFPAEVTPPTPTHKPRTLRLTTPFMTGEDVVKLQETLNIVTDGIFGPDTKDHVITFQHVHKLRGDGVVGPVTYAALYPKTQ